MALQAQHNQGIADDAVEMKHLKDIDAPTAINDMLVGEQVSGIWSWVKKSLSQINTILGMLVDTRANILAVDPSEKSFAFATDIRRLYISDGTNWYQIVPNGAVIDLETPDMGYEQDSARTGYGDDYITDKRLSNILIGSNDRNENGGLRVDVTKDPDTFEIYLRGMWQTIVYDMTTVNGDFRHTPLNEPIYIWRGDSVLIGLNGRPIIQEYQVSMGAYPPAKILNGGAF
jgi:hypothetical protein